MKTLVFIAVLASLLFASSSQLFGYKAKHSTSVLSFYSEPARLDEDRVSLGGGLTLISREIKEENRQRRFRIEAKYPQIIGSTSPRIRRFNAQARTLVMNEVARFRKNLPSNPDKSFDPETGSYIEVGYEVITGNNRLVSLEVETSQYFSGAAHPNSHSNVINFDLRTGRSIRLAELFRPGSKYLAALSKYVIAQLKKELGEFGDSDWISRGAAPTASNFSKWTIAKDGLRIRFDPYEVGPYAAGPQVVVVPFSTLKSVAAPGGLIASISK